jgi:hypothetical protein
MAATMHARDVLKPLLSYVSASCFAVKPGSERKLLVRPPVQHTASLTESESGVRLFIELLIPADHHNGEPRSLAFVWEFGFLIIVSDL